MKYIIFILFPLFSIGQNLTASDAIYFNSSAADKVYLNGEEVWSASPPNLYTYANASNPIETNATTGWDNEAGTTIASVATTTPAGGGSYVIEITSTDGSGSDRGKTDLTVESGKTYYYEYWGRQTVGSQGFVRSWVGCTGASSHGFTSSWTKYTGTFTATATTAYPRFYAADSPGSAGDKIQVDLFIYYEQ